MTNTETVAMIKFGQSCLVNFSSRISIFKKTPPSAAVSAPYVGVVRPILPSLFYYHSPPFPSAGLGGTPAKLIRNPKEIWHPNGDLQLGSIFAPKAGDHRGKPK